MQIQSTSTPASQKPDERPAVTERQPVATRRAAPDAPTIAPSKDDLTAAVNKLNEAMPPSAQSLEFEIDKDSKEVVVKIIDRTTREVVRQIPTEEALEMAKSIDKMQGLLIRQTA